MSEVDLEPLASLVARIAGEGCPYVVEPMPGGASTRKFFRVQWAGSGAPGPGAAARAAPAHAGPSAGSAVAFFVPDATRSDEIDKTDGQRPRWPFVEVQELLAGRGVRVPAIVADGSEQGWLVVEDLGDDTLANYLVREPGQREAIYREAVRDLAVAQRALERLPEGSVVGRRAFDEDLLEWEIQHFREWAIEARGLSLGEADREVFDGVARRLARRIAGWPRGFVHRDYQSRNLMVRAGDGPATLVWIDFQDALLGPRVYDLVALLNDSYQTFDRDFVERRLDDFAEARGLDASEREVLGREFDLVTVQRKLKDAGRFVFIDRVKGNPSFLRFVEPTLAKVRSSLDRLGHDDDMVALAGVIDRALGGRP